jgi:succinate-acetate transporter protein
VSYHRGIAAIILAFMLGVLLIIITVAIAFGVQVSEMTRAAAVGAVGILVGALATYLAKK